METLMKPMLQILFLIIILWLVAMVYRHRAKLSNWRMLKNEYIESVEKYYLANDRWLEIVRVGSKILVLGITPNSINKIEELNSDDLVKVKSSGEEKEFPSLFSSIMNRKTNKANVWIVFALILGLSLASFSVASAAPDDPFVSDYLDQTGGISGILNLIILLTVLVFVPFLLMTLTVFPRILIVLSFTRNAMGTQQTPPNQVLIGIALILTFFIMSPIFTQIKAEAYDPYMAGELETNEAYTIAMEPLREFMFNQASTEPEGLNFYLQLYGVTENPETLDDIPTIVLMMAFITSELKKAFIIGFIIYIPFIIIDMVVASVLMSMGMMMIPPTTISLPFKILLFVVIDGWTLLFRTLVSSFG